MSTPFQYGTEKADASSLSLLKLARAEGRRGRKRRRGRGEVHLFSADTSLCLARFASEAATLLYRCWL